MTQDDALDLEVETRNRTRHDLDGAHGLADACIDVLRVAAERLDAIGSHGTHQRTDDGGRRYWRLDLRYALVLRKHGDPTDQNVGGSLVLSLEDMRNELDEPPFLQFFDAGGRRGGLRSPRTSDPNRLDVATVHSMVAIARSCLRRTNHEAAWRPTDDMLSTAGWLAADEHGIGGESTGTMRYATPWSPASATFAGPGGERILRIPTFDATTRRVLVTMAGLAVRIEPRPVGPCKRPDPVSRLRNRLLLPDPMPRRAAASGPRPWE